jgi:hypothetical protein
MATADSGALQFALVCLIGGSLDTGPWFLSIS